MTNKGEFAVLSYVELWSYWRKGLRNGNWHRLGLMERIFYRAAIWYAKMRSKITNSRIVTQLASIVEKLQAAIGRKILQAGMERVTGILTKFQKNGVFKWAPRIKTWLKDLKYIFWLGLN